MEIPDYDDLYRLETKLDKLEETLEKLITVLPIPKTYSVNGTGTFLSVAEAEKEVERRYQRDNELYAGSSGCSPVYNIYTNIQTPEEIEQIMKDRL